MTTPSMLRPGALFNAEDRCDRCNARASILARLHTGGTLLFCGHHGRLHRFALDGIARVLEEPPVPEFSIAATEPWAA